MGLVIRRVKDSTAQNHTWYTKVHTMSRVVVTIAGVSSASYYSGLHTSSG